MKGQALKNNVHVVLVPINSDAMCVPHHACTDHSPLIPMRLRNSVKMNDDGGSPTQRHCLHPISVSASIHLYEIAISTMTSRLTANNYNNQIEIKYLN
jgi:hypothetical protein